MKTIIIALIALSFQSCLVLRNNKPETYLVQYGCTKEFPAGYYTVTRVKEGKKLMLYDVTLPDSSGYDFLSHHQAIRVLNGKNPYSN